MNDTDSDKRAVDVIFAVDVAPTEAAYLASFSEALNEFTDNIS